MVELTKGDFFRLAILGAWGLSWSPFWEAASDELLKHPWDAIGAAATASATLVALWFGLADVRRRQDETRRARNVYRWVFGSEIATLEAILEEIEMIMAVVEKASDGDELGDEVQPWLERLADDIELTAIDANTNQLANFPDNVGQPIAALAGQVRGLAKSVRLFNRTQQINEKQKLYASTIKQRTLRMREYIASIDWRAASSGAPNR